MSRPAPFQSEEQACICRVFCSPRSALPAIKWALSHLLCHLQGKGLIGAAAPEEDSNESEQTAAGPRSSSPEAGAVESGSGTASTSSSSSGAVTGRKRKRSHSDIKLLALDLDGTLLSSESKVLPSSVEAIKVGQAVTGNPCCGQHGLSSKSEVLL